MTNPLAAMKDGERPATPPNALDRYAARLRQMQRMEMKEARRAAREAAAREDERNG